MDRSRKLLIWYWGRQGGGALITLFLARRLIEAGFGDEFAVSLSRQNGLNAEFLSLGVPVSTIDTFINTPSVPPLLRALPTFRRTLRAHLDTYRPTTILVPMLFGATLPLLRLARRSVNRFIYVVHDARSHPGERVGLEQSVAQFFLIRSADTLVTASQSVRKDFAAAHPRLSGRLAVEPLAGLYDIRRSARTKPDGRPLRLLVAGRQVRYKGYERLAQALKLIGDADLEVTIAGHGPESGRVAGLFDRLPGVRLRLGWAAAAEHQRLFDDHDVLLCPYDEASQSALICDALSVSMPSIVTPVGALPEQIGFGNAGWICKDMSPAALARLILAVARGDVDYAVVSAACATVLREARATSNWPRTLGLM